MPVRLTAAEAPAVASAILVGDKAVRGLKKVLKAHCAAHGPVTVGDVVFTNKPITQRAYPVDKVVKVLMSIGQMGALDVDGLTVSHSALARVFAQYPDVARDLEPYEQSKTIFRFGGYRPGDDDEEP
jgi:hypothetical protein